jgi:1-deoxy-D-xylulose-5-phosphate reductoisomerase
MRIPIAYALAYPERMETPCERLDLVRSARSSSGRRTSSAFPALGLARSALREGGAKPAILNAANEVAVASFLDSGVAFLDIAEIAGKRSPAMILPRRRRSTRCWKSIKRPGAEPRTSRGSI